MTVRLCANFNFQKAQFNDRPICRLTTMEKWQSFHSPDNAFYLTYCREIQTKVGQHEDQNLKVKISQKTGRATNFWEKLDRRQKQIMAHPFIRGVYITSIYQLELFNNFPGNTV